MMLRLRGQGRALGRPVPTQVREGSRGGVPLHPFPEPLEGLLCAEWLLQAQECGASLWPGGLEKEGGLGSVESHGSRGSDTRGHAYIAITATLALWAHLLSFSSWPGSAPGEVMTQKPTCLCPAGLRSSPVWVRASSGCPPSMGCCNEIPWAGWFRQEKSAAPGSRAGGPRPRCQQIWCLVRVHFQVHR